jgi:hypothetical protein
MEISVYERVFGMIKALFAIVGVLLISGVIGMSYFEGDKPTEETQKSAESTEVTTVSTMSVPTVRTVTISGFPWEELGADVILKQQESGETVYLFSDAEALEGIINGFATSEEVKGAPITKAESGQSFANYLEGFIQGTEKFFPDKQDYYLKLREIKNDLNSGSFANIPQKVDEAKALRIN